MYHTLFPVLHMYVSLQAANSKKQTHTYVCTYNANKIQTKQMLYYLQTTAIK